MWLLILDVDFSIYDNVKKINYYVQKIRHHGLYIDPENDQNL